MSPGAKQPHESAPSLICKTQVSWAKIWQVPTSQVSGERDIACQVASTKIYNRSPPQTFKVSLEAESVLWNRFQTSYSFLWHCQVTTSLMATRHSSWTRTLKVSCQLPMWPAQPHQSTDVRWLSAKWIRSLRALSSRAWASSAVGGPMPFHCVVMVHPYSSSGPASKPKMSSRTWALSPPITPAATTISKTYRPTRKYSKLQNPVINRLWILNLKF